MTNTAASSALAALGGPTRKAIFERLAEAPCSVGKLAAGLLVSRPAVSQHLQVLKRAVCLGVHGHDLAFDELEVLVLADDPRLLHAQDFVDRERAVIEALRRPRRRPLH